MDRGTNMGHKAVLKPKIYRLTYYKLCIDICEREASFCSVGPISTVLPLAAAAKLIIDAMLAMNNEQNEASLSQVSITN